jgi:hypothetical protein
MLRDGVNVGENDRMAEPNEAGWPATFSPGLFKEFVFASSGLFNRVLDVVPEPVTVATLPLTGRGVVGDSTTLYFDAKHAMLGMCDHKIALTIDLCASGCFA